MGAAMTDVGAWAAYERLSREDAAQLTLADRRLLALGGLRTEVNNGGFHQYFFNSAGDLVTDALDAAEAAGADELASLIRRGLSLLNVPEPADRVARQSALGDIEPEEFADLDDDYTLEASPRLGRRHARSHAVGGRWEFIARRTSIRLCRRQRGSVGREPGRPRPVHPARTRPNQRRWPGCAPVLIKPGRNDLAELFRRAGRWREGSTAHG
jgi:hypothetical protein